MRITPKVIEQVISEIAGEDVVPLVKLLKNKKNVSEFKLAEDLKIGVNIVRNMLYRLHDFNLVSFMRKKDKVKGWYIYYWTFNMKRVRFLLVKLKNQRLLKLQERLTREQETHFYKCDHQCMRLDFDQAMNFEFKCPECGQLINQEDNSDKIKAIQEEMAQIEHDLAEEETVRKVRKPKPVSKKKKVKKAKKKTKKKVKKAKKKPAKKPAKKVKNKVKKKSKKR